MVIWILYIHTFKEVICICQFLSEKLFEIKWKLSMSEIEGKSSAKNILL